MAEPGATGPRPTSARSARSWTRRGPDAASTWRPIHEEEPFLTDDKTRHVPFPEEDNGAPKAPEQSGSYTMVDPRFREIYFQLYKETYKPSVLDRKTKELVAIAASLAAKCQGCLEGHIKKALKLGATKEEISESIA